MLIELWMEQRKLSALESALSQKGTTIRAEMDKRLEALYESSVCEAVRHGIATQIEAERREQEEQYERSRRFTLIQVIEAGTSRFFKLESEKRIVPMACCLRNYLRASRDDVASFTSYLYCGESLSEDAFHADSRLLFSDNGQITNAYLCDFDRHVFLAADKLSGWRAFSMPAVSTAIYYATRKIHRSEPRCRDIFFERLCGKELSLDGLNTRYTVLNECSQII